MSVLSAAYDRVLVETVGVGQSETDVEHVVDSVCLVVQPGSGDVLQFIKAGIMEIPDVLVVNKGDQALAQRAASDLAAALSALRGAGVTEDGRAAWQLPVLVTSARDRQGIDALAAALEDHLHSFTAATLATRRRAGAAHWALALIVRRYGEHALELLGGREKARAEVLSLIDAGRIPLAAAGELGAQYLATIRSG